jgi:hypothetical protein
MAVGIMNGHHFSGFGSLLRRKVITINPGVSGAPPPQPFGGYNNFRHFKRKHLPGIKERSLADNFLWQTQTVFEM